MPSELATNSQTYQQPACPPPSFDTEYIPNEYINSVMQTTIAGRHQVRAATFHNLQ
jgi:hypothetical protein